MQSKLVLTSDSPWAGWREGRALAPPAQAQRAHNARPYTALTEGPHSTGLEAGLQQGALLLPRPDSQHGSNLCSIGLHRSSPWSMPSSPFEPSVFQILRLWPYPVALVHSWTLSSLQTISGPSHYSGFPKCLFSFGETSTNYLLIC